MNHVNLGPVFINNHEWAKFVHVNKYNYLRTGYFTRKDKHSMSVFRYLRLNEESMQEVRKFGKTRVMSDKHKLLVKEAFKHTDELFTIKY